MTSQKRDRHGRPSDERRCTFSYPGGRRCNEFRAKGHDSLCLYHYRREQKLDPSTSPEARGIVSQVLGTREQFKTATEVNDALAKVFALRGRKLISVRDATLFTYMSQVMLISLNSVQHEFTSVYEHSEWEKIIERILQLPGATLPPLESLGDSSDDVISRREPTRNPSSSTEDSSREGGNSADASSDDVIPRSGATRDPSSPRAASHPSSSTEGSSRPPRPSATKNPAFSPPPAANSPNTSSPKSPSIAPRAENAPPPASPNWNGSLRHPAPSKVARSKPNRNKEKTPMSPIQNNHARRTRPEASYLYGRKAR